MNLEHFANALFLFNKPIGMTSQAAISRLKRKIHVKKIGHAGTLDKFASGLLIIATGQCTRLLEAFVKLDKMYDFTVDFSRLTDTLDPEGTEQKTFFSELEKGLEKCSMRSALNTMKGRKSQQVPHYSAIKIDGKRLSDWQRTSSETEMEPPIRNITVYNLRLLEIKKKEARFFAHVSSGTYIRSLGRDLGRHLGLGGTTIQLNRRKVGSWNLRRAISIKGEELIIPERWKIQDTEIASLGAQVYLSAQEMAILQTGRTDFLYSDEMQKRVLQKEKKKTAQGADSEFVFFCSPTRDIVGLARANSYCNEEISEKSFEIHEKYSKTVLSVDSKQKKVCQKNNHLGNITNLKIFFHNIKNTQTAYYDDLYALEESPAVYNKI